MKPLGIVRKVDALGRIVLPKELRRTFGIKKGTPLEVFVDGDHIVYRIYKGKSKEEIKKELEDHIKDGDIEKALNVIEDYL